MTAFNRSTCRRLKKLRQIPSVWEGDRRAVSPGFANASELDNDQGECILWVDGSESVIRALDVVPLSAGPEAVVRTLLRAMESPHSSVVPARPQKIVVRDREIQFFLRGVLQDLDIAIDYVQDLPLIDEIFRGLQDTLRSQSPQLPPDQSDRLLSSAYEVWEDAPWQILDEEKIISIQLSTEDEETLYISILGMMGMEYGILMYRSLDSLKLFRQKVLMADEASEELQEAFLEQDCFFVTFEQLEEIDRPLKRKKHRNGSSAPPSDGFEAIGIQPAFGSLHPLEGMRPVLYEDEATIVTLALTALHRFFQQHQSELETGAFTELLNRYRLPDPQNPQAKVSVKVATMPDLAAELFDMTTAAGLEELEYALAESDSPILRDDLVPDDTFFSLGSMSWDILDALRLTVQHHQPAETDFPTKADSFPVILIQTSRPKALTMIEQLQAANGLASICFNPGEDPFAGLQYDLGLLQTHNGELHLFGEFENDDPVHLQARRKWDQRCKKTGGYCGLIIAKGWKGASKGNPNLKDMMALFEVRSLPPDELGLGSLQLMPSMD